MVTGHQTKDYRITYIHVLPTETHLHRKGNRVELSRWRWGGELEFSNPISQSLPLLTLNRCPALCPTPHNSSLFLAKMKNSPTPKTNLDHVTMKSKETSPSFFSKDTSKCINSFTFLHWHTHKFHHLLYTVHANYVSRNIRNVIPALSGKATIYCAVLLVEVFLKYGSFQSRDTARDFGSLWKWII